jgi:pimeloyl-ACP methyl ester carboxylesterase
LTYHRRVPTEFAVDVPGGRLVGWESGSGTPALVLHGGPLSDYTAPLAALFPELRMVRYQQRGLSPSTLEPPFDVETHVADAVAVLEALGLDRVWAIGHSWGGHLALHLAVAHPERLAGVVAIDPLGAVPDGGWGALDRNLFERLAADSPEDAARAKELDERAMAGNASDAEADESLGLVWPYYFSDPRDAPPVPDVRSSVPLYAAVVQSVYDHFERRTLEDGLPRFSGPMLVAHGEDDPLPLDASRKTVGLVPGARLATLPRCGHFPWLERPDELAAVVRRFISQAD